jgi:sarcosine oxidase gamma subunit
VEELAAPLDDLADALVAHMPDAAQEIWTAQRGSARFWHNTLWDVAHFCEALEGATADAAVDDAAQAVRAALAPGPDRFLIAEAHNGAKVERCGGMTAYLLPPLNDLSRYYAELDFAQDHRWLSMLEAYHAT